MSLNFAQQENIGFRYVVDALRCDSPYGDARVRRLRFYASHEAEALLEDLGNVCAVMDTFEAYTAEYGRIERLMMQLKDIRRSVERCAEGPLNEVELFELKRFLLQSELIAPVFAAINAAAKLRGIEIRAQSEALALLDLDGQHAATFFIPDTYSQALRAARREKRLVEEELRRARPKRSAPRLWRRACALPRRRTRKNAPSAPRFPKRCGRFSRGFSPVWMPSPHSILRWPVRGLQDGTVG